MRHYGITIEFHKEIEWNRSGIGHGMVCFLKLMRSGTCRQLQQHQSTLAAERQRIAGFTDKASSAPWPRIKDKEFYVLNMFSICFQYVFLFCCCASWQSVYMSWLRILKWSRWKAQKAEAKNIYNGALAELDRINVAVWRGGGCQSPLKSLFLMCFCVNWLVYWQRMIIQCIDYCIDSDNYANYDYFNKECSFRKKNVFRDFFGGLSWRACEARGAGAGERGGARGDQPGPHHGSGQGGLHREMNEAQPWHSPAVLYRERCRAKGSAKTARQRHLKTS